MLSVYILQRGGIVENKTKNKTQIKIADNTFTVVSDEEEAYTLGIASKVDKTIKEICKGAHTSVTGASMLAAMNYCNEMTKAQKDISDLKAQLDFYLEELVRQKDIYNDLLKDNKKLKSDIETYRIRLKNSSASSDNKEPLSPAVKPVRRQIAFSDSEEAAEEK